ncbi:MULTISPECIES: YjcZ family sporulation protein [Solibacillus]|uniref:YjcZ family sporulation protein n=1 Tax=Solibacillus palustris TaxID=2908203 RepID=A0ABS9UDK0_9BACL|nr:MULTISPECIES: YjcZ family sporulation protein [Solibacillus]MCH7322411.1 YjcZ family sporulation protein [Solibacillus sp. MA9]
MDYSGYGNCYGGYNSYSKNNGSTFVLIVVLFILLIIVGATFMHGNY